MSEEITNEKATEEVAKVAEVAEAPVEEKVVTPANVDNYKEELEKLKNEGKKKEHDSLAAKKRIASKESQEDRLTKEEAEELVREAIATETQKLRRDMNEDTYNVLVSRYTTSDSEAELTRHHLKNTIKLSGNSERDVRNAVALANQEKLNARQAEMRRANDSLENVDTYSGGSRKTAKDAPTPKLSPEDMHLVNKLGLTPEEVKKAFE